MSIISVPPLSITTLEITVVSAEGLDNYSSYFSRIRPFIILTKLANHQYHGGRRRGFTPTPTPTPTRDHKFRVPVDPTFFSDRYSCLHLQLYTKRRFVGPAQLGWCLIPATDIGLLPPDSVRYLSYRLRARDGSRGHAIINLSIRFRLEDYVNVPSMSPSVDTCQTVIGMPVTTAIRGIGNGDCSTTGTSTKRRWRESNNNNNNNSSNN